ncbi:MAG: hypothetical protein CM1200mP30_12030 [Pseudomonadota bacterium]|nr:MAG: hypothetical protein CM1200mP30_12030 [Pseudomonadota bacterium]
MGHQIRNRTFVSRQKGGAGIEKIPFTSGILIGIGETRRERIKSLLTLRDLHENMGTFRKS